MKGILIAATPPGKRRPYYLKPNESHEGYWQWSCSACSWMTVRVWGDQADAERTARKHADAHDCGAGWSTLPIVAMCAVAGVQFASLVAQVTPTKEDRQRWYDRQQFRKLAQRR